MEGFLFVYAAAAGVGNTGSRDIGRLFAKEADQLIVSCGKFLRPNARFSDDRHEV
jgi:hypothetical protein